MSLERTLELRTESEVDGQAPVVRLLAPAVGTLTDVIATGAGVAPGQHIATLVQLGRSVALRVPEGVRGVVVSTPPRAVHAPVGFGSIVVEIDTSGASAQGPGRADAGARGGDVGLVVRCRQSGRFYRRSAPAEPAFVDVGSVLEAGATIGLIEVMKTFGHVHYRPQGNLPERARVTRVLVGDGVDVEEGAALFEVEPS